GGTSLLRARGGISGPVQLYDEKRGSSPRTRRYFRRGTPTICVTVLFSAHAEVFPTYAQTGRRRCPLLRARGGISMAQPRRRGQPDSSPRTRRYFRGAAGAAGLHLLFSAHAE